MSFAGDLRKLPIADVFNSIHQNSLTGALAIRDSHGERLVAFKAGYVAGCAGPKGEEHGIADELVRRQLIDEREARPSRFFRSKGALQRTLHKKKLLEPAQFVQMTRALVLERVYDCFLLEEGTFEFLDAVDKARFDDDEEAAELKISPNEILMEAMRRVDEFKRIKRTIPSFREVYVATRQGAEEDPPIQREILQHTAEGTLTLQAVFLKVPHARFACCEAVMVLLSSGALRVATAPEYLDLGKAAEARNDLDAAAAYYARGLAYERGNQDLTLRRVAVLERLGRNQEAADDRKLFAGTLLEKGDKRGAAEHYGRAAQLAPTDPLPLERLLDLHVEGKDLKAARDAAEKLVRTYMQLGLGEKAKAVYPRLLVLAPRDRGLRERLAETHQKLNEPATAATILKELAQEVLDEGDPSAAATLLRRALAAQPDDPKAQALLKDLESGEHAQRRRRNRLRMLLAVVVVIFGLAVWRLVYEANAITRLRPLDQELLRTVDVGPEPILNALVARENHRREWAGTWASTWDAESGEALVRLYVRELERQLDRPRYGHITGGDPISPTELLVSLRAVIEPTKTGDVTLAELVATADTALRKGDVDAARHGLTAANERATEARKILTRAGPEGRSRASVEDLQRKSLNPLLTQIDLLRARIELVDSAHLQKVLEEEAANRLPPSVTGAATGPSDAPSPAVQTPPTPPPAPPNTPAPPRDGGKQDRNGKTGG